MATPGDDVGDKTLENVASSTENQRVLDSLLRLESTFQDGLKKVNSRIDTLEKRAARSRSTTPVRSKEPERTKKRSETERSRGRYGSERSYRQTLEREDSPLWADRTDTYEDVPPLRGDEWEDDEAVSETADAQANELSSETTAVLQDSFTNILENSQRRDVRDRYPVPNTPATRTPKVDDIFTVPESKFSKNSEAKQVDKDLLQSQGYLLDVARPLASLLDGLEQSNITIDDAKQMTKDAIVLLGNANAQTSRLRRKRILRACNPDIANLAERPDLFVEAAPYLFGDGFETKMKERAEAVRVLQKSSKPNLPPQSRFFRGSRPQRGGGYNSKGGRGRFNPMGYRSNQQQRGSGSFQRKDKN